MHVELLYLLGGIGLLLISGEAVIKSAQIISSRLGISETFVGLTILSIGTSLAELGTHVVVSFKILEGVDYSGLAVGTNIGSNIIQITAILGLVALFMKLYTDRKFLENDYIVMLGAIALLFIFSFDGHLSRMEGLILAGLYIGYIWALGKGEHFIKKVGNHRGKNLLLYLLLLPIGIAGLLLSATVVVNNAETLSMIYGIRETLIGTLIIGVGTALPELTTSVVAIYRKSAKMAAGVLIGSNITNPLFMMGIGAAISGYTVSRDLIRFDLPFWFLVSALVMVFLWKGKIKKWEALSLIGFYGVYVIVKIKYLGLFL